MKTTALRFRHWISAPTVRRGTVPRAFGYCWMTVAAGRLEALKRAFPLVTLALVSCSDGEKGEGSVVVSAYGESFIEEGIPASEISDGWQVHFDRFEVSFAAISVGGRTLHGGGPIDLAEASRGEGQELGALLLPSGNYTQSSFVIERMEVEGSASREGQTKTFHWIFDEATAYADCETITSVAEGETSSFQLTVHADHLFSDSLVASAPELLFGPLAESDEDGDGAITQRELARQDIGAYDPGNEDGIDDLWAWLSAQAKTLGHVDGEGHCHVATEK